MALNLMIADPDPSWLAAAKEFFEEKMYKVDTADNGKNAQLQIYNNQYFACIINLSLQRHSGAEVLKFIKNSHKALRVVVILENKDILTAGDWTVDKLIKMGATEIVVKPFEMAHLADVLEGHQTLNDVVNSLPRKEGQSSEVEVGDDDSQFTKIKIDEFYSSKAVLFDIFIRLGQNKYIKILHCGDTFSPERIDNYRNKKNVEFLYFHNNDRKKYIQYLNFLGQKFTESEKVSDASKMQLLGRVSDKFLEEAFTIGVKPQVVEQGKELAQSVTKMVQKQKDLWKVLREWQVLDPNAYSHTHLVMIYAAGIIFQFEWQSKSMLETSAMAAMFHDIGKMKLPPELMSKKTSEMTPEELEQYKKHPELGAQMLEGHLTLSQSVRQIILQHHECFDGTGFPNGLKANKVLTLANIIRISDDFVHKMMDEGTNPMVTLKNMLQDKAGLTRYASVIVENFIRLFADPAKLGKNFSMPNNSRLVASKKFS
jgi:putative nucleotidyltransferase with HDIG domain